MHWFTPVPCKVFRLSGIATSLFSLPPSPYSFLDIVQPSLAAAGFVTARLDGKTPAKRRGEVLRSFASGAALCWCSVGCAALAW